MEKPRAKRRECLARIKVSWQSGGVPRTEWGMLQDKSLTGFGFRLPVAMTSGCLAAIQIGFTTHFGIVRHCTKTNGQYFVGFELCEVDESVNVNQANKNGAGQPALEPEKETPVLLPQVHRPLVITPPPPSRFARDDFEMTRPPSKQ